MTEGLEEMLPEIQQAFKWMLKDITWKADMFSAGNYSEDLKHAIIVGEWLDKVKE